MRIIDEQDLKQLQGRPLGATERFNFDCHPGMACFNRCCRNLNLFLYPYDVLRLKRRLVMPSDQFIDRHVAVVLRPGSSFPDVLLRMRDDPDGLCPFVTHAGCSVYSDRPDTCRKFPMEQGVRYHAGSREAERIYLFRPPDFCRGPRESRTWTPGGWAQGADDREYDRLTLEWADLKPLFQGDPWKGEGPEGPKAKMTFMATYNIDAFRAFVLGSSFLKRYRVDAQLLQKIRKDDVALLRLGFAWIRFYLGGTPSKKFSPR